MNKYNKIMNRVTVDPEMKSRVMSAVSAAIREQSEGAVVTDIPVDEMPVRKKAKKTPIALISTIAAAVVVILGVLFVFKFMGSGINKSADSYSTTVAANGLSTKGQFDSAEVNSYVAAETTAAEEYYESEDSCETTMAPDTNQHNYTLNTKTINEIDIDNDFYTIRNSDHNKTSGVIGDARIERICNALPFDFKGFGSGTYSEDISYELLLGEEGEKVIVFTANEGTDILKQVDPSNKSNVIEDVTPNGIPVRFCLVEFGNVSASDVTSDLNAAVFTKGGMTYLIVFSDYQPLDVIAALADAV